MKANARVTAAGWIVVVVAGALSQFTHAPLRGLLFGLSASVFVLLTVATLRKGGRRDRLEEVVTLGLIGGGVTAMALTHSWLPFLVAVGALMVYDWRQPAA